MILLEFKMKKDPPDNRRGRIKIVVFSFIYLFSLFSTTGPIMSSETTNQSAHQFAFVSIQGQPMPLSRFAGKALLIVNTASRCGFTGQYAALQELWENYQYRGLVVLGVPSNDFGGQEPGTESEIKAFCEVNFDVDFPLTEKVKITGSGAHPFYQWARDMFGAMSKPRWNFHKYLITPDGRLVDWFSSVTSPKSGRLLRAVEAILPK